MSEETTSLSLLHMLKDFAFLRAAQGHLQLSEPLRNSHPYREAQRYLSGGGGAATALLQIPFDADLKARVPDEQRAQRFVGDVAPGTTPGPPGVESPVDRPAPVAAPPRLQRQWVNTAVCSA